MITKLFQLLFIVICLWWYIDMRLKLSKLFNAEHTTLLNKLMQADRNNIHQSADLDKQISRLATLCNGKKQKELVEQNICLWRAKFEHLYQ